MIGAITEKGVGFVEEENGTAFLSGVEKREESLFGFPEISADDLGKAYRLKWLSAGVRDLAGFSESVVSAARSNQKTCC